MCLRYYPNLRCFTQCCGCGSAPQYSLKRTVLLKYGLLLKLLTIQTKFRSWLWTNDSIETTNHGVFIIGCAILLKLSIIRGRPLYNLRIQLCKNRSSGGKLPRQIQVCIIWMGIVVSKGSRILPGLWGNGRERVEGTVRSVECGQFRQLPPGVTRVFTSTTTFYSVPYRSLLWAILFWSF